MFIAGNGPRVRPPNARTWFKKFSRPGPEETEPCGLGRARGRRFNLGLGRGWGRSLHLDLGRRRETNMSWNRWGRPVDRPQSESPTGNVIAAPTLESLMPLQPLSQV